MCMVSNAQNMRDDSNLYIGKIDSYGTVLDQMNMMIGQFMTDGIIENRQRMMVGKIERDGIIRLQVQHKDCEDGKRRRIEEKNNMRRQKIMQENYNPPINPFGTDMMLDALKVFCIEQGMELPIVRLIEVDGVLMPYAIPLHLVKNDQMDQFDAEVVFLLVDFPNKENREAEKCRLRVIAEEFGRPCLLTMKAAFSPHQDNFYRNLGFMKMPVTWSDEAGNVYEVFLKDQLEMGSFVSLMEHVEYIGKEIIYV